LGWRLRAGDGINSILLLFDPIFWGDLAMSLYPYLLAHLQNGAGGTVRQVSRADMFAKGDKKPVDLDPVATWECFTQRNHRLFWR
jgi:hypothetical protein